MKFFLIFVALIGLSVKCENLTQKEFLDLNDGEDQAFLWKTLFSKLNSVLSETEKLSQHFVDVNKRLDDITKRLDDQDETKKKSEDSTKCLPPNETWRLMLRRQDDSVNFARNWQEYKHGFGNAETNFFIGLERLHQLTTMGPAQELRITMTDFDNENRYAYYDLFRIGSESEMFALTELGAYSGNAGDGLRHHKGQPFSTYDRDNNKGSIRNCAQIFQGGWWYYDPCYIGHLVGPYRSAANSNTWGVSWDPWRRWNYSMKFAAMEIRAKV